MQWFRGGLVFEAHRLVYHSILGLRVIKKKSGVHACSRVSSARLESLSHEPYPLHPTPQNQHPTPNTQHPTPYTLHPTPYTLRLATCSRVSSARLESMMRFSISAFSVRSVFVWRFRVWVWVYLGFKVYWGLKFIGV